jgi:two-component system CheB/CheR fusion protein
VQPQAHRQQIALTFSHPVKSLLIDADPVRVEQIITNIVTNAVKYTPEGVTSA